MIDYDKIKIQKLDDEVWPVGDVEDIGPFFKLWKTIQGKCGRGTLEVEPAWGSFRRFYEWASKEAPDAEDMELLFGHPEKEYYNDRRWRLKSKMDANDRSVIREAEAFFIGKRLKDELDETWIALSFRAEGEDPYWRAKPDFPALLRGVRGNLAKLQVEYGDPEHAAGLKAHLTKLGALVEQQILATVTTVAFTTPVSDRPTPIRGLGESEVRTAIRSVITTVPEGRSGAPHVPIRQVSPGPTTSYLAEIAEAIAKACEYAGEEISSEEIYGSYYELQDEYLWAHQQVPKWEYGTIRDTLEDLVRGRQSPLQRLEAVSDAVTAVSSAVTLLDQRQRDVEAALEVRCEVEKRHQLRIQELIASAATVDEALQGILPQVTSEFEKVWETIDASAQAMKALSDAVHRIEESLVAEKRDRLMSFPTGVKQALTPPSKLNPLGEAVQSAAPQADAEAYKWVKPVIDKAVEPEAAAPVSQQEVVIIGLLGPQARDIETRLGDKFAFTFYSTDTKSQRLQNGCKDKVVVVMTGFMAHRTYEAVKKVASRIVHSNGGISGLERDLTELYVSLTANAA